MPFVPTAFNDGTVMDWAAVAANNSDFRIWSSQVPVGDVNAGAIRREHLVRPVVDGFPVNGFLSTFQIGIEANYGLGSPIGQMATDWGSKRRRLALNPPVVDGVTETWHFPIGATIRLLRAFDIEILCTLEWQTRADVAAGVSYPDGIGGGARGGYLAIHSRDRTTNVENQYFAGLQHLYPEQVAGGGNPTGPNHETGLVVGIGTFGPGVVDFGLVYHRANAPNGLRQIDFSRIQMTIEGV